MSFFRRKFKAETDVNVVDVAQSPGVEGEDATTTPPEQVRNADSHMKRLRDQHRFDPYMDIEKLDAMDAAIETGNLEKEAAVENSLIAENSPYAEVRTAVSTFWLHSDRHSKL